MDIVATDERITGYQDGVAVGWVDFDVSGNVARLFHTEVLPAMRNSGAGTRLVVAVLEWFRDNTTYRIVGVCPFIPVVIRKHPEFAELTTR
jgi:predicted GNAT family acetyltransferase